MLAEIEDRPLHVEGAAFARGIMSDGQPDFDRLSVDLNDRDAQPSSAKTVWVYVDPSKVVGDTDRSKVLASLEPAKAWITESDPDGVTLINRISH